ncbi:aldose 1-epimerase [Aeromicrobium sp. CTD01-1L150]|uniref:aldose 1-epimerase n=1 Tax=Aeromicrobium sp. CTD01-1L150 TaxID=3341830 RepID=UPI0035C006D7
MTQAASLRAERGPLSIEIDPERGGRLVSFVAYGHELLSMQSIPGVEDSVAHGCYPMVPWAGRIRDGSLRRHGRQWQLPVAPDGHALHGLGRDVVWEQIGPWELRTELAEPWPVRGEARLAYALTEDRLHIRLRWDGGGPGASLGLHPWFRRVVGGVVACLELHPLDQVQRGDDGLPTGRIMAPQPGPWDDCFTLATPPRIIWPGVTGLTLYSDADWWVVFTEPEHALCVEPQTAPPDAFDHPRWESCLDATEVRLTMVVEDLRV